jgi:hypothetical protein
MNPVRQFRSIAQRHLETVWTLFPQRASELGLHQFDARLGENDPRTWQALAKLSAETLARSRLCRMPRLPAMTGSTAAASSPSCVRSCTAAGTCSAGAITRRSIAIRRSSPSFS